jgi:TRAP-type C4-dicarboxylate transport system permease small subunit
MIVADNKVPDADERESANIPGWLVFVGGVPLLAAMAIEFASVIARNLGTPFPGPIELVQAAILLSSSTAIVIATLSRSHAKVRLLLSRMQGTSSRVLKILNAIGGTIFFLALTIGSAWIVLDMWEAAEQSEILGVPWLPLRCFAAGCMLTTAVLYAFRVIGGVRGR